MGDRERDGTNDEHHEVTDDPEPEAPPRDVPQRPERSEDGTDEERPLDPREASEPGSHGFDATDDGHGPAYSSAVGTGAAPTASFTAATKDCRVSK